MLLRLPQPAGASAVDQAWNTHASSAGVYIAHARLSAAHGGGGSIVLQNCTVECSSVAGTRAEGQSAGAQQHHAPQQRYQKAPFASRRAALRSLQQASSRDDSGGDSGATAGWVAPVIAGALFMCAYPNPARVLAGTSRALRYKLQRVCPGD